MSQEEQDAICPLVSEMAMVAAGFRDEGRDKASADAAVLREFKVSDKPEKVRAVVSKLADGVTTMVYATPTLEPDTEAGFHFAACLLNFYQDINSLKQRLPALLETAEGCQHQNSVTEARIKCILNRFQEG